MRVRIKTWLPAIIGLLPPRIICVPAGVRCARKRAGPLPDPPFPSLVRRCQAALSGAAFLDLVSE